MILITDPDEANESQHVLKHLFVLISLHIHYGLFGPWCPFQSVVITQLQSRAPSRIKMLTTVGNLQHPSAPMDMFIHNNCVCVGSFSYSHCLLNN